MIKKKLFAIATGAALLFPCVLSGCSGKAPTGDNPSSPVVTDKASLDYVYEKMYPKNALADEANGFSSRSDVKGARFLIDGKFVKSFTSHTIRQDMKFELRNADKTRFVNAPGGMAFTLPTQDYTVDYSIAKYRTQIKFDDSVLTVSMNTDNPYMTTTTPWYIYNGEWLIRYLNNDDYIAGNGMKRLNGTHAYDFTAASPYGDREVKEGYDVYRYDILIEDNAGIELPYYNIAIIRKVNDAKNFGLFVMKSKTDQAALMNDIVDSYSSIKYIGTAKNYFDAGKPQADEHWNAETKAYYNRIVNTNSVQWGVFSYSMPGYENQLLPSDATYQDMLGKSKRMKEGIEAAWGHNFDIYPTYTHIGTGSSASNFNGHHFPLNMANELAGGNGVNGKPVLQFTYQFTLNNNYVLGGATPMFDIMRGKFDAHFRRLARDMKSYGKPVLFRLNNEMNTDWTSYCGMLTLCDPDIFNETWKRLYRIFEEEGVDNCIWIWNPVATSCPYSSWGEDLAFYPGNEYVHLLGATNYEMNNYDKATAATQIESFKKRYQSLYEKNLPAFSKWPMIISEFACGSGGDVSGELGRNASVQASWVSEMFAAFAAKDPEPWAKSIKGAIWFNCNDYEDGGISNRLRFYDPDSNDYADLSETLAAFKNGFASLESKK